MSELISLRDIQCGHDGPRVFDAEAVARLGLKFPETHSDAVAMARLSVEARKMRGGALCQLPFCCTVEAEAFGANVNRGDAEIGPRVKGHLYPSPEELAEGLIQKGPLDLEQGRIHEVIEACKILAGQGEHVSVEVGGPMSVLNGLLDLPQVFKAWRKKPDLMREILNRIGDELLRYMARLKEAGASVLSFADPTGTGSILGPKFSVLLTEDFLLPFLKRAADLIDEKVIMPICPRTTHMLVALGYAEWRPFDLGRSMPYDEACLSCRGKIKFVGQACLKNKNFILRDGVIQELRLVK